MKIEDFTRSGRLKLQEEAGWTFPLGAQEAERVTIEWVIISQGALMREIGPVFPQVGESKSSEHR